MHDAVIASKGLPAAPRPRGRQRCPQAFTPATAGRAPLLVGNAAVLQTLLGLNLTARLFLNVRIERGSFWIQQGPWCASGIPGWEDAHNRGPLWS